MKSKGLRLFRGILLLAVLTICVTACVIRARVPTVEIGLGEVWVDEAHHHPLHDYYYYPDVGVYFDPVPGLYFWLDGGRWISGPRLPGHIVIHGGRERFRTDADRPYVVHERVVERHRVERDRHERERREGERRQRERQARERPGRPMEGRERERETHRR